MQHIKGLEGGAVSEQISIHDSAEEVDVNIINTCSVEIHYIGFPGCTNAARTWIAPLTEILNPVVAVTTDATVNNIP